jgi:hypothetical protein
VAHMEYVVDEAGTVLSEGTYFGDVPENIWDLARTGKAGLNGERYVFVTGEMAPGNGTVIRYQSIEIADTSKVDLTPQEKVDKEEQSPTSFPAAENPHHEHQQLLEVAIAASSEDDMLQVHVLLKAKPTTPLGKHYLPVYASAQDYVDSVEDYDAMVETRKAEIEQLQSAVTKYLLSVGAEEIESFFLTNDLVAYVPAKAVQSLLQHVDVKDVGLVQQTDITTSYWDGGDMKVTGGTNTEVMITGFFDGGYTNPAYNDVLRIMIIDSHFDVEHRAFDDREDGPTRVYRYYDCTNSPCTQTMPVPASDHGTICAGLAAGDFRDDQYEEVESGDDNWQRRHSGQAEEAELVLVRSTGSASYARAMDLAVSLPVDVTSMSQVLGGDTNCNGLSASNMHLKYYALYEAGILGINSAGNAPPTGSECTLKGMPDSLSAFTVGGVASTADECDYLNYLECDLYDVTYGPDHFGTAQGGVDLTIDGSTHTKAFSAIDVLTNACPYYQLNRSGTYTKTNTTCGTSLATPQVAGAAILFKDWFLDTQGTFVNNPGQLFVMMLGMSDRGSGFSGGSPTSASTSFGNRWGGGRFQLRRFGANDVDVEAPFWWSTGWTTMGPFDTFDINVGGSTSDEPAALTQYKAYAWFAEETPSDVADIDLYVRDNCDGTPATVRSDLSRDTKSMVRLDDEGASESLCMRLRAYHVPSGETRKVHFFHYYSSGSTSGR